ncbi:MAG: cobyrinate a,c-diamide synthase [Actinomycetota bacterium]
MGVPASTPDDPWRPTEQSDLMPHLGPRLVVAGTHSGVGKTTIATGLMAAYRAAGARVTSAKVGPDFLDPGYHALATGRAPRNLDAWMSGPDAIAPLAARAGAGAELLVIEGVMGLFDGAVDGSPSSTADVAALLDAPVVLVVDASAMSASVAALVRGFRDHDPRIRLAGAILNRVAGPRHRTLLTEALEAIDVEVLGSVDRDDALIWRDRHLGLVPVEERPAEVSAALERLGAQVAAGCDLARLRAVADAAPTTSATNLPEVDPVSSDRPVRIAVAGGPAFTFLYRDNVEALEAAGAELVAFDPLIDEALPDDVTGLVVGGGFPEVHATRLADNEALLSEVGHRVGAGLVTWAECGGLLWLARSLDGRAMAGALAVEASMTDRLTLGYRHATAVGDTPVLADGDEVRGHEFHYSTAEPGGDALRLRSRFGSRLEGHGSPTLLATYLHQHLGTRPEVAARFVAACAASPR